MGGNRAQGLAGATCPFNLFVVLRQSLANSLNSQAVLTLTILLPWPPRGKLLSIQFNIANYKHYIAQQISRTHLSYVTEIVSVFSAHGLLVVIELILVINAV